MRGCIDLRGSAYTYAAYDHADTCLYVGVTNDLFTRLAKHRQDSSWYRQAHRVEWVGYETRFQAEWAESVLIGRLAPRHNVHMRIGGGSQ